MSKNVTVTGTDKVQIIFRSAGEQDLKVGEGIPVVSTGNKVNGNAQAHGSVAGILVQNPA